MQPLTIPYDAFCRAMSDCARIGFMQAIKAYEPEADYIKERDVKRWLCMLGIEKKKFDWMVGHDEIKKKRIGTSANSPWYYSKADIIQKMCIADIHASLINQ